MYNRLILLATSLTLGLNSYAQMGNFSVPERLGSGINTEAEETMPLFSPDSSKLYFTRFLPNGEKGELNGDVWSSDRSGKDFSDAAIVDGFNNKANNAVFGFSTNGNSAYLSDSYDKFKSQDKKNYLKKGLAISILEGKSWGAPVHVDVPTLDIEGDAYGFHISTDETVLIISYKGPGSLGDEDLYYSTKEGAGWTVPVHMGSAINSTGYEISPYLSTTKDTLFFASNGFGGEGDADIFYCIKQNNSWTDWSAPINLGPGINSLKFDAFFSYSPTQVYWASNRDGEKSDIYRANILPPPPLLASASGADVTVYQGKDGKIDMTPKDGVAPYTFIWSNGSTLEDPQDLVKGTYTCIITDKIGQTAEVSVDINEPAPPVVKEISLAVNPIYFDLAKFNIRKDAAKELDKIVKIMNDNPTLEIELGSHTDCQASYEYNMILSENRAKASAEYIKQRISNPARIAGKGYGETQLKVDCPCEGEVKSKCSEKEHKMNRRTEFRIKGSSEAKFEDVSASSSSSSSSSASTSDTPKGSGASKGTSTSKFRTDIPVTAEQAKNIENGFYIVSEGETLFRVYVNTKVKLAELRRINNLKSNDVKPGRKLLLK